MNIVDSHFHWWPARVLKALEAREGFPRADINARGGYTYTGTGGRKGTVASWAAWYDLDEQFAHMDALGHEIDVIGSIGPLSVAFSELPRTEGLDLARMWNEEMAGAQRRYPGRFFGTAAVPLSDAGDAIEVLDEAVTRLGLVGANLPGSVGLDPGIDAERLDPFYARAAELGVPLLLHPTDAIFAEILDGYNEALHMSLGRVVEVSAAAMRLVYSGLMERHPGLKIVLSHTGGALPYQSGRMDKNGGRAGLPQPPSHYMRQMYTDTVSPHAMGMRFAVDYYGADRVMYGTDYPCWDPATCLELLDEIGMTDDEARRIYHDNAQRLFRLGRSRETQAAE